MMTRKLVFASLAAIAATAILLLSLAAKATCGGSIAGSVTTYTTGQSINLTSLGATDWAAFGYTANAASIARKNGGGSQISALTNVGSGTLTGQNRSAASVTWLSTWSDGATPNGTATNEGYEVYDLQPSGNGMSFTVPAGTTPQTLKVYVLLWDSTGGSTQGKLTAALNDGSAPTYIDTTLSLTTASTALLGAYNITYSAANAGSLLTVQWLNNTSNGNQNVQIYAAALQPSGAPVDITLPTINGTAQVGQPLTENGDTWTNVPITSRFYQWQSAGVNVGTSLNSYTPVAGDLGHAITVAVTATNSVGASSPATSAATSNVIAASGPVVAFPGAEGFGAVTRGAAGASGARVIHVTTTSDTCTGCGSFRDALTASGPRYVVFDTGGTITINDTFGAIVVSNPYLTIACQTAPGGGIQFTKWAVRFVNTHDIIVRYCKSRAGNTTLNGDYSTDHVGFDVAGSGGSTGETVTPTYNVILDHVDMEFASRDNMDTWDNVQNLTVQRSIMADGIPSSNSNYGFRGYNLGGTADPGLNVCCNTTGVSIHHNLFAHNDQRNPDIRTVGMVELVNNIMYDYGSFGTQIDNALASNNNTFTGFGNQANIIGNYFQAGSITNTARLEVTLGTTHNAGLWVYDNISPHRTSATPTTLASNWQIVGDVGPNITCGTYATCPPDPAFQASAAFTMSSYPVTTQNHASSTLTVFNNVLADVGSNKNVTSTSRPHINAAMDALTTRMINETQNANGSASPAYPATSFITYPTLATGTNPTDTDCDGIPDDVETAAGLSTSHGSCTTGLGGDSLTTNATTGYTYLEDYINGNGGIN